MEPHRIKKGVRVRNKRGDFFAFGYPTVVIESCERGVVWFDNGSSMSLHFALELLEEVDEGPVEDSVGDLLNKAAALIGQRGKSRDDAGNERSMDRTVRTFNAMTDHNLTEEEGWLFMRYLKDSRSRKGEFNRDDYEDGIAYAGLQAEAAINNHKH